jgi:type II secretory pathway pseudopilin PulG
MIKHKDQTGITLLEMMLVLAIIASAFVFGLRLLTQFQFQVRESQLNASVNQLFNAAAGFYSANCRRALDSNGNDQSPGELDPVKTDSSGVIKPTLVLSVTSQLLTPGYLPSSWHPNNLLVDNKATEQGYYVQFNRVTAADGDNPSAGVVACTGNPSSPCENSVRLSLDPTQTGGNYPNRNPSSRGNAVTWVVQVGVKLSESLTNAQWTQIKNDLNAQCISTGSGNEVVPCTSAPAANGYLVWTRHPSSYIDQVTSNQWVSDPYVKDFKMQYTNDGMGALTGVKDQTGKVWYDTLSYLCNG